MSRSIYVDGHRQKNFQMNWINFGLTSAETSWTRLGLCENQSLSCGTQKSSRRAWKENSKPSVKSEVEVSNSWSFCFPTKSSVVMFPIFTQRGESLSVKTHVSTFLRCPTDHHKRIFLQKHYDSHEKGLRDPSVLYKSEGLSRCVKFDWVDCFFSSDKVGTIATVSQNFSSERQIHLWTNHRSSARRSAWRLLPQFASFLAKNHVRAERKVERSVKLQKSCGQSRVGCPLGVRRVSRRPAKPTWTVTASHAGTWSARDACCIVVCWLVWTRSCESYGSFGKNSWSTNPYLAKLVQTLMMDFENSFSDSV